MKPHLIYPPDCRQCRKAFENVQRKEYGDVDDGLGCMRGLFSALTITGLVGAIALIVVGLFYGCRG